MMTTRDTPGAAFPITVHAITVNLLVYLLEKVDRSEGPTPFVGLDPDELAALRNMSIADLCRVTDQGQPVLRVSVDPNQLRLCVARARMRDDVEATKRWFVERGTPQLLMQELYGTSTREFRALRSEVDISSRLGGRPRAVRAADVQRVRDFWALQPSHLPLAERYRLVGEAFPNESIASLYGAIHGQ